MSKNETARQLAPKIGIMMLETSFPRPVGDIGHPGSWPWPVLYEVVGGAHVRSVVGRGPSPELEAAFVASGQKLVARGARGLLTSCGFLIQSQAALARHLPVPVASSALLLVPMLARMIAPGTVGVLTYDAAAFTPAHLAAAGADPATPVAGLGPASAFHAMVERGARYERDVFEAELVASAMALCAQAPDIGALVLECTNFPPFAGAIRSATSRPVFDILTLGRWLESGLVPNLFAPPV